MKQHVADIANRLGYPLDGDDSKDGDFPKDRSLKTIRVNQADWPGAQPADVAAVCKSVASVFAEHGKTVTDADVNVYHGGPTVLFQPEDGGARHIKVSVAGSYWANLAFQFADNYLQLLIKFENNYGHKNQWFTDAVRTAATAWVIDTMGDDWLKGKAPYPHWNSYGEHLKSYSVAVLGDYKKFDTADEFAEWFKPQLASPDGAKAAIAGRILPVFKVNPEYWEAIEYINIGQDKDADFQTYIKKWHDNCPDNLKVAVKKVAEAMGFKAK